jgi:hypothetical protein
MQVWFWGSHSVDVNVGHEVSAFSVQFDERKIDAFHIVNTG